MKEMVNVKTIVYFCVALVVALICFSTMIMPNFRTTYEQGFGDVLFQNGGTGLKNSYCVTPTNTLLTCTSCNATAGLQYFLDNCDRLLTNQNDTHCYKCSSFGFKASITGLMLLVIALALVGFGLAFIGKKLNI